MSNRLDHVLGGLLALVLLPSCSSLSAVFATATPSPTATFTPSPTPPPTPTATTTPTPTPLARTPFRNDTYGFTFTLPKGWEAIAVTSKNADVVSLLFLGFPGGLDPQYVDMVMANGNPALVDDGYAAHFRVSARADEAAVSLPLQLFLIVEIANLERLGASVLTDLPETRTNAHGLEVGTLEWLLAVKGASSRLTLHCDSAYFNTKDEVVIIIFAAPERVTEQLGTVFEDFVDSLELSSS